MLTSPGKLSLGKGIAIYVTAFLPKLPNDLKYPPDISNEILLAKEFTILVVCLVVRHNACGNSSSSKLFLPNLNIIPVLFFCCRF